METFDIEEWRSIARSITPGDLRDSALDAVNAVAAAQTGLCSWKDWCTKHEREIRDLLDRVEL